MNRMKFITKAILIGLILLIAAVTITAGCVETGDTPAVPSNSTEPAGPEPTGEQTAEETADTIDYNTAILGDWKYTFTTDSGDTTMIYHFDQDHVGTFSTGKSTSGIHWIYNEENQTYMINYDKLQQQEDMIIVHHEGKAYLYSLGGGYACEYSPNSATTPTVKPTPQPTTKPTVQPTVQPTPQPTTKPTPALDSDKKMAQAIANAIEPTNSTVRTLALSAISKNSSGSYNIDQICDIYSLLRNNWTYVNDPNGSEYFAPASESARLLKGDCDDFAILMASCIEAIGGSTRVICANGEKIGHAYAEVYMTKTKSDADNLVKGISKKYNGDTVYYHIDYGNNGDSSYWLNLDWDSVHPGGKFFKNKGSILIVYPDGYYKRQNFSPSNTYN